MPFLASRADSQRIGAIKHNMAYIEFTPGGDVITANDAFLDTMGYELDEVRGKHHRIFCDAHVTSSTEYQRFWAELAEGRQQAGTFPRVTRQGESLWLEATYFPVRDGKGEVTGVIKIASDVTARQEDALYQKAVLAALDASMAVIEFAPDGTILRANEKFLDTMGYSQMEIAGRHHRLFCDQSFYDDNPHFWEDLTAGKFSAGQYQRFTAAGSPIWLEATYNPVLGVEGRVEKVVKFAVDITARVQEAEAAREAVDSASSVATETEQIAGSGLERLDEAVNDSRQAEHEVDALSVILERLNAQSVGINEITDTISRIATQTRILALNASVEAARAGEHGRGFNVVAEEIRTLAEETARSANEISNVLHDTVAQTKAAADKISETSAQSRSTVSKLEEVRQVVSEMLKGAREVSHAVERLHR